jgi:hypothetical protein
MWSENLAAFLRALVADGLRVERRVSPTDCTFTRGAAIHFRSLWAKDTLQVSTEGRCQHAWLAIRVNPQADGRCAYEYFATLADHLPTPPGDARAATEALVTRILSPGSIRSTQDLPPYLPVAEYCAQHHAAPRVSQTRYEALRRSARPMLRHPTGRHTSVAVIHVPGQLHGQTVLQGGADECGATAAEH